jgi:hypothetical protein
MTPGTYRVGLAPVLPGPVSTDLRTVTWAVGPQLSNPHPASLRARDYGVGNHSPVFLIGG